MHKHPQSKYCIELRFIEYSYEFSAKMNPQKIINMLFQSWEIIEFNNTC